MKKLYIGDVVHTVNPTYAYEVVMVMGAMALIKLHSYKSGNQLPDDFWGDVPSDISRTWQVEVDSLTVVEREKNA